ncbi:MAG: ATP-binding protein [Streptomyces sp.]|uniref:ATP-binding protein n=1 Tax=Streptomyces sp. TaxID=1931 RepID=UPI003D6B567E
MTPETSSPTGPGANAGTGTALALLVAVLVTGPACLFMVYAAPPAIRASVAWGSAAAAVLLSAAVGTATYAVITARGQRTVLAAKDAEAEAERAVAAHFADVIVPVLVERLRSGASAQTALATVPAVANSTYQRVLHSLAIEVHRGEGLRAAAMAACANAAGRVQALATSMAADLREMEHKYADENVLGDLLHLDHRTAQTGRLADSIAVLTGARTGRRWAKPIVMESILRGAMGRISGYQRVRLHSSCTLAVAGHAAEGVMHALGELMDNAANFSPPTSEVHVYVEEVSAGVVITIEDGGLVMGEVAMRRAEQAVSSESLDLTNLSGTRLGLAVVGRLAHKHGLSVSFRPSAHGGTGVLLMIPQALVTQPKRENRPPARESKPAEQQRPVEPKPESAPAPEGEPTAPGRELPKRSRQHGRDHGEDRRENQPRSPAASAASEPAPEPPAEPAPEHASATQFGESGLPKRRRGQTLAATEQRPAPSPADRAEGPIRSAEQSGSRFGAFRRAVQGGSPPGEQGARKSPVQDVTSSPSPAPSSYRPEDNTE